MKKWDKERKKKSTKKNNQKKDHKNNSVFYIFSYIIFVCFKCQHPRQNVFLDLKNIFGLTKKKTLRTSNSS